jgi:hypothetical protein
MRIWKLVDRAVVSACVKLVHCTTNSLLGDVPTTSYLKSDVLVLIRSVEKPATAANPALVD